MVNASTVHQGIESGYARTAGLAGAAVRVRVYPIQLPLCTSPFGGFLLPDDAPSFKVKNAIFVALNGHS